MCVHTIRRHFTSVASLLASDFDHTESSHFMGENASSWFDALDGLEDEASSADTPVPDEAHDPSWLDELNNLGGEDLPDDHLQVDAGWADALDGLESGSDRCSQEVAGGDSGSDMSTQEAAGPPHLADEEVEVLFPDAPSDQVAVRPPRTSDVMDLLRAVRTLPDDKLDQTSVAIANHYYSDKLHVGSISSDAVAVGVDADRLSRCRTISAGAAYHFQRCAWQKVEEHTTGGGMAGRDVKLLFYMDFMTYDGVDFHLKTSGVFMANGPPECKPALGDLVDPGIVAVARAESRVIDSVGVTKVLNLEAVIGMLISVDGKLQLLYGTMQTILGACDRLTAEAMRAVLVDADMSTQGREKFARRLRCAVTDGAAVNFRTERHIVKSRPGWFHLHLTCNLHRLSSIHTKTFDLVSFSISGMIAVAKSLDDAGLMGRFRVSVMAVVKQNFRFCSGGLTEEAMAYRKLVLDVFVGRGAMSGAARIVIARLAGGDWRERNVFWFRSDGDTSREQALDMIETDLMPLLFGHAPTTFPRSRWTGMDNALKDVGLGCCIHGLMQEAFTHFLTKNYPNSRAAVIAASGGVVPPAASEADDALEPNTGSAGSDKAQQWAAENRANRAGAATWFSTHPDAMRIALRIVLEPMMKYLRSELELSSGSWQTLQASKVVHLPTNESVREAMSIRDWPVLVAAKGSLDRKFLQDLEVAHDLNTWNAMLDRVKVVDFRHQMFKLLSRQGASCHELVISRRSQFPFRLFCLLLQSDSECKVSESCESSRDGYSASFLSHHAGKLDDRQTLMELVVCVIVLRTSIVRIESLNATIRRHLTAAAVQCKTPSLAFVSAEFFLGKIRRRLRALRQPPGSHQHVRRVRTHRLKRGKKTRRAPHPNLEVEEVLGGHSSASNAEEFARRCFAICLLLILL